MALHCGRGQAASTVKALPAHPGQGTCALRGGGDGGAGSDDKTAAATAAQVHGCCIGSQGAFAVFTLIPNYHITPPQGRADDAVLLLGGDNSPV